MAQLSKDCLIAIFRYICDLLAIAKKQNYRYRWKYDYLTQTNVNKGLKQMLIPETETNRNFMTFIFVN